MTGIRIAPEALSDLDDGFWFYEVQQPGLGDYFASCLRADIDGLKITAGIHRTVFRDYRRLLSRVFPYAIYYTLDSNEAVVWAVVDCRCGRPRHRRWKQRWPCQGGEKTGLRPRPGASWSVKLPSAQRCRQRRTQLG